MLRIWLLQLRLSKIMFKEIIMTAVRILLELSSLTRSFLSAKNDSGAPQDFLIGIRLVIPSLSEVQDQLLKQTTLPTTRLKVRMVFLSYLCRRIAVLPFR